MKERPILFSGPMVQAILGGRKTQTRRVVNPQPDWIAEVTKTLCNPSSGPFVWPIGSLGQQCGCPIAKMKYGVTGDRLWVRESFTPRYFDDGRPGYKADWTSGAAEYVTEPKWKPSIHMPRAISRISLEITNVRVERLQDITLADLEAEGVTNSDEWLEYLERYAAVASTECSRETEHQYWAQRWDNINGKKHPWSSNPWVWVIEF